MNIGFAGKHPPPASAQPYATTMQPNQRSQNSRAVTLGIVGLTAIMAIALSLGRLATSTMRRPSPRWTTGDARQSALVQPEDGVDKMVYLPVIGRQYAAGSLKLPTPTPVNPTPPVWTPDPPAPHCIQGVVFNDVNGNGIQDDASTEPALPDFQVTIFPDRNNNGQLDSDDAPPVETIVTTETIFRSVELEAGTYLVDADAPDADPPWRRTQPKGAVLITLEGPGGDFCEAVTFGYRQ